MYPVYAYVCIQQETPSQIKRLRTTTEQMMATVNAEDSLRQKYRGALKAEKQMFGEHWCKVKIAQNESDVQYLIYLT